MKRCPECRRDYYDDTLVYCLEDGNALVQGSVPSPDEPATAILSVPPAIAGGLTQPTDETDVKTAILQPPATAGGSDSPEKLTFSANRAAKPLAALIAAVVILVGGFFGYKYFAPTKQIESIAVMPFVNESGNVDVEYLSDGMTETLISSLTKLPNLNVKSRSSVFRYKGKETDAKTIGNDLNVQTILNGRVAQRGDLLTLSLELVDTETDNAIWSQQYSRKQSDLVVLQSEIARDITGNLRSRLSGTDAAKVAKNYTADPEAYQLYLKGRFQWNRRTPESLRQAIEFFGQAVAKDPNYALAYSGLAESFVLFPNYSAAAPRESMPKAKAAALRAIELDDSLAESHVALGIYYSNFAWNLPEAEKEFRRAIELNPNYAPAYQQYGIEGLAMAGRFDEAIATAKRAVEIDPVSPIIGADLANILTRARRFDDAIAQLDRVAALDPDFWVTYWYLGIARFGKKQYPEAVAAYRKALASNDNSFVKAMLTQSLVKVGQRAEAAKLLAELESESERRFVASSSLALAYEALGQKDKAFGFLQKEVDARASRPMVFPYLVIWDDFRDDPRFAELLRRVEKEKLE